MGYFRRKAFKKLRERVSKFDYFEIAETCQLFGPPFGTYSWSGNIHAENAMHALRKFFKLYRVKNKERHERESRSFGYPKSTAHFKITNKRTGFKTYF